MANSLIPSVKLGGTSTSALLRAATTAATEQQTFKDDQAAFQWEISDKGNDAFNTYSSYINGRINAESGLGTIKGQTKALELSRTLYSAMKSNVSSNIQQASIGIDEGTMSKSDKYNLLDGLYNQALSNGDAGLAQSLRLQADTLARSIQTDRQTAAAASHYLSGSGGGGSSSSTATTWEDYAKNAEQGLKDLVVQYSGAGMAGADRLTKQLVQAAQGRGEITAPKGADGKPNSNYIPGLPDILLGQVGFTGRPGVYTPGSILWALQQGLDEANNAGKFSTAQTIANKIGDYAFGRTKIPIPAATMDNPQATRDLTIQQLKMWVDARANGYEPYTAKGVNGAIAYTPNPTAGFVWAKDIFTGQPYIQSTYYAYGSGNPSGQAPSVGSKQYKALTNAGFTVVNQNNASADNIQVILPKDAHLPGVLPGQVVTLVLAPNGHYMVQGDSTHIFDIEVGDGLMQQGYKIAQVNVNTQKNYEEYNTTLANTEHTTPVGHVITAGASIADHIGHYLELAAKSSLPANLLESMPGGEAIGAFLGLHHQGAVGPGGVLNEVAGVTTRFFNSFLSGNITEALNLGNEVMHINQLRQQQIQRIQQIQAAQAAAEARARAAAIQQAQAAATQAAARNARTSMASRSYNPAYSSIHSSPGGPIAYSPLLSPAQNFQATQNLYPRGSTQGVVQGIASISNLAGVGR